MLGSAISPREVLTRSVLRLAPQMEPFQAEMPVRSRASICVPSRFRQAGLCVNCDPLGSRQHWLVSREE